MKIVTGNVQRRLVEAAGWELYPAVFLTVEKLPLALLLLRVLAYIPFQYAALRTLPVRLARLVFEQSESGDKPLPRYCGSQRSLEAGKSVHRF